MIYQNIWLHLFEQLYYVSGSVLLVGFFLFILNKPKSRRYRPTPRGVIIYCAFALVIPFLGVLGYYQDDILRPVKSILYIANGAATPVTVWLDQEKLVTVEGGKWDKAPIRFHKDAKSVQVRFSTAGQEKLFTMEVVEGLHLLKFGNNYRVGLRMFSYSGQVPRKEFWLGKRTTLAIPHQCAYLYDFDQKPLKYTDKKQTYDAHCWLIMTKDHSDLFKSNDKHK